MDELTKRALATGEQKAAEVLAFRAEVLLKRTADSARAETVRGKGLRREDNARAAALAERAGIVRGRAVLVAEGDSWFDYPWNDVLKILEDDYDFDVESVADRGDTIEEMAYSGGQLANFTRRLEKVLGRGDIPRAILLSGGGNDVAGTEFRVLLNHADSALPGLNDQVVAGVVNQRIRLAYITLISAVTHICEDRLQDRIPIIVHGYDYPVPDGRGYWGGLGPLPGPWLEPGFRAKGYGALSRRIEIAEDLIERFNRMLEALPSEANLNHVRYVDLRRTLSNGADYQEWWDNELHPTREGFRAVTAKIAAAIHSVSAA